MTKPHKHAALIKAWADGAQIQTKETTDGTWRDIASPGWLPHYEYRIKPTDIVRHGSISVHGECVWYVANPPAGRANLRLTFDADTGALKSAEVIK